VKEEEISSLVRYRLDQAGTALEDALYLSQGSRSPQSVINRAYYAMFYSALALLQKIGKVPSKHTGAVSLFDTEFVAKNIFPIELSKNFHKAFELRQLSDYKTSERVSRERAEETLKNAIQFVESIKKYLANP